MDLFSSGTRSLRENDSNSIINNFHKAFIYTLFYSTKMAYVVYGIPNCNTVKKALNWLNDHQIAYEFHDYKKKSVSPDKLQSWTQQQPWEKLLNRAGTTWKQLPEEEKSSVLQTSQAIDLMLRKNSVIKRPIIEDPAGRIVAVGFDESQYAQLFRVNDLR